MRKRKQTSHGKATRWPAVGRRTRGAIEQAAPVEKAADAAKADPALVDESSGAPLSVSISGVSRHVSSQTSQAAERILAALGRVNKDPLRERQREVRQASSASCEADCAVSGAEEAARVLREIPDFVKNPEKVLARLRTSQRRADRALEVAVELHRRAFERIEEALCSALRLQAIAQMQSDYFRQRMPVSDREGMLLVATGVEPARCEALIQKIQAVCSEFQAIDPIGFLEVQRKASQLITADMQGSAAWRFKYGGNGWPQPCGLEVKIEAPVVPSE